MYPDYIVTSADTSITRNSGPAVIMYTRDFKAEGST